MTHMKTKSVALDDLTFQTHPATKLFRSIELATVYKQTKNMKFKHPSMDLGGGDGYLTSLIFDDTFTYNVDNGEAKDVHISIRKKRYKKVLIESAEKTSIRSNALNFVFSNSVIEHIPDNEAVLSEVSRTLKKGGVFIFTSPSDKFKEYLWIPDILKSIGLGFLSSMYKNKRNQMLNHYHTYSHKTWTQKLKKHGLIVKKYAYYIELDNGKLWDKIAWETKLRALFDKNADKHVYEKYKDLIAERYKSDKVTGDRGASLFIYAVKK